MREGLMTMLNGEATQIPRSEAKAIVKRFVAVDPVMTLALESVLAHPRSSESLPATTQMERVALPDPPEQIRKSFETLISLPETSGEEASRLRSWYGDFLVASDGLTIEDARKQAKLDVTRWRARALARMTRGRRLLNEVNDAGPWLVLSVFLLGFFLAYVVLVGGVGLRIKHGEGYGPPAWFWPLNLLGAPIAATLAASGVGRMSDRAVPVTYLATPIAIVGGCLLAGA
jgi:hypothetical protein